MVNLHQNHFQHIYFPMELEFSLYITPKMSGCPQLYNKKLAPIDDAMFLFFQFDVVFLSQIGLPVFLLTWL